MLNEKFWNEIEQRKQSAIADIQRSAAEQIASLNQRFVPGVYFFDSKDNPLPVRPELPMSPRDINEVRETRQLQPDRIPLGLVTYCSACDKVQPVAMILQPVYLACCGCSEPQLRAVIGRVDLRIAKTKSFWRLGMDPPMIPNGVNPRIHELLRDPETSADTEAFIRHSWRTIHTRGWPGAVIESFGAMRDRFCDSRDEDVDDADILDALFEECNHYNTDPIISPYSPMETEFLEQHFIDETGRDIYEDRSVRCWPYVGPMFISHWAQIPIDLGECRGDLRETIFRYTSV